jgi:hypothetical protein
MIRKSVTKVKIVEPLDTETSDDIEEVLENVLSEINPDCIIAVTQNKLIGYTIFYKELIEIDT